MDLQYLYDRLQIVDLMNNIAVCADSGDWDKLISHVFAEEVTVNYSSLFGGDAQTMNSTDLVNGWKGVLPGFKSTQHLLGNHQVTIDGDKASGMAYVRAHHYLPNPTGGDTWVIGGFYNYTFVKTDAGWRVSSMKLNLQYAEGNQTLIGLAQTLAGQK